MNSNFFLNFSIRNRAIHSITAKINDHETSSGDKESHYKIPEEEISSPNNQSNESLNLQIDEMVENVLASEISPAKNIQGPPQQSVESNLA